jgi:inner membrane protein
MLNRTHFAITLFFVLLLLPLVQFKTSFIILALVFTLIPDVDTSASFIGKYKIFRPVQFFVKHRGFFHSFLFLIIGVLFFLFFYPIGAFGFFIGYSSHLMADSFTLEGVRLFYPLKKKSTGSIRSGGKSEATVFVVFLILDIMTLLIRIF